MIGVNELTLISHHPQETQRLGRCIGKLASAGDIILLVGDLGAGKTCLTQGIARGLGIKEYAVSPSFVLVRELYGRLPLYHIDLYRLERAIEIAALGLDDYLYGNGISVIEWADKGRDIRPEEYLLIELEHVAENERRIRLNAQGKHDREMLEHLSAISARKPKRRPTT
jgi:tRNA threonylcarbamoyladenosine biosynthesis protein TsaE